MSYVEALHYQMQYFNELNMQRQMSPNQFPRIILLKRGQEEREEVV